MGQERARILIVDDEADICRSCAQILVDEGYDVDTCLTGENAIKKYRSNPCDVVFLDLKMPGITGMEALERMREIDNNIIAVVITGYATIESAVASIKNGAFDFLPKPFTPGELRLIANRAVEQKRLLAEADKLRRDKEKMREQFVSMVSHQLKVPLAAVLQYFEVILGGMAGRVNEKQKQMILRSHTRLAELIKLIDDWLSFTRIDSAMITKYFSEFDIVTLIQGIVDFLIPVAQDKKVRLLFGSKGTCIVTAHKDFIREALTNLINNAIIYNKPGGEVHISVHRDDDSVIIQIRDTGIGIGKDALPNIFNEFYRDTRVKPTLGSGLGLSIVKRIIDGHHGTIDVESIIDVGSVFTVKLKAAGNDGQR